MNPPTTHLLADAGGRVALCGTRDPRSTIWAPWAPVHKANYGATFCDDCWHIMVDELEHAQ